MTSEEKSRVCLGVITGVHGLKGEVKIKSYTQEPCSVAAYGELEDEAGVRIFGIEEVRPLKGDMVVARIASIGGRNEAEALKGISLYVAREKLSEPDEGEWYYSDLIGLEAAGEDGALLGEVISVQNFGAGDLLEILLTGDKKTVLLPFTAEAVPEIDIAGGRVTVSPPEGLLDE